MALTHPGWAVLVVLLIVATGPVASTHVAPAHDAPTVSTDATIAATGTPLDDGTNTTGDTTNTTDDTTNTTDDTTEETTNETTETSESTTESTTTATNTTDDTTNTTTETVENTTTETVEETTETADATGETTENTTEETTESATETVDDTTNTTESTTTPGGSTETVATATESLDDAATDAVDSTTDGVDSTNLTGKDATLTDTSLTDSTLTDSTLADELNESTDTIEETVESTDDGDSILSADEDATLALAGDSDSVLGAVNAAGSTDFVSDGSEGDAADGEGTDGADSDDGSDDVDAETSVSVESTDQVTDPVERAIGAVWQAVDGFVPEDAPVGPVGATGVGALAVLAVVSRQWFVQSAGTGMPTLLSSGLTGSMGDWVEKLKRLAVPLRYSRYDDSDPLEHDTRRVLNDAIEAAPGINLTDLAEQTGVPLSTARHHVRVLADENLITTAKRRGKRRYYPVGADGVELADALSEPPKAAVLHALATHAEAHVGLLADELDRDPSTITHHLQALAADGLVERERNGRTVVNRLAGTVEATLVGDDQPRADHAELPADD